MPAELTLSDLRLLSGRTEPGRISFAWQIAEDQDERVQLIEEAVRWVGQEFSKTRHVRQGRSEDAFTIDVITALKAMQIDAHHDAQYGGHCDIVVEASRNFLWLAEAKIHSNYDWLLQGFNQLDTRYSTGGTNQTRGCVLIYSYNARIDEMMFNWREHLAASRVDVVTIANPDDATEFRSTHVHKSTGRTFSVWHASISLHHNPQDKKP